ncbi:CRISPR-associated endonuclease Cas1 [Archaeoglobales archaeon]|nr:MAG: CRISPR-associated endonuclease Cas1 [Archaeoglobales archaeon]
MRVIVDGFGKFIGKEGEVVVIKEKGKIIKRVKPDELKQLVIFEKASISSDAINLMLLNEVDIVFMDNSGVTARIAHPVIGTVKTRREQYKAYYDERGVILSKEFVKCKLRNQMTILSNLAKARKDRSPEIAEKLILKRREIEELLNEVNKVQADCIDDCREEILGIEGKASTNYWDGLSLILPMKSRKGLESGSPRYAQDITNAMLNYGYSILHSESLRAVELAGLDCYAGFLHSDRAGRTSLALDLMEEFRQPIVDRVVIKLLSYKQVKKEDGEMKGFTFRLKDSARKKLLSELIEKLDSKTQYEGKNYSYSTIMLLQARKIATFLRGERRRYSGFTQRW